MALPITMRSHCYIPGLRIRVCDRNRIVTSRWAKWAYHERHLSRALRHYLAFAAAFINARIIIPSMLPSGDSTSSFLLYFADVVNRNIFFALYINIKYGHDYKYRLFSINIFTMQLASLCLVRMKSTGGFIIYCRISLNNSIERGESMSRLYRDGVSVCFFVV